MGNCQAIDTARVVIQHPNGKQERLCCPVTASFVMKTNPGCHVALLISTTTLGPNLAAPVTGKSAGGPVRVTRIKLLRPTETLNLGQVYRLITTEEVMKGLWAKKCAKMKKNQVGSVEMAPMKSVELEKENQMKRQEKQRPRISRSWQPSLHSISEGSS